MTLTLRPEGDRTIVRVDGELCLSSVAQLAHCLQTLRSEGADCLILDLRTLQFLDSAGIRLLITMDVLARAERFELAISTAEGQPQKALQLAGMTNRPKRVGL